MEDAQPRFLDTLPEPLPSPELQQLRVLHDSGLPVAPILVVPAEAEAAFYRLNNLPARLESLFAAVGIADPDEDDLEELAPDAVALLRRHYLLDEFIDAFYDAIAHLPSRLRLRRPDEDGFDCSNGRSCLLALKLVWAEEWTPERLLERLPLQGALIPPWRPALVHAAGGEPAPTSLRRDVEALLGRSVEPLLAPGVGVVRLREVASGGTVDPRSARG